MAQIRTIFFAISCIYWCDLIGLSATTDSYLTLNFSNYIQTIEEVVHRSRLPISRGDIPNAFNTVKEIAEIVAAIEDHYSIIKSEIILPGQYDTIDSHFRQFMERLQTFLSYLIIIPKEITDNLGEELLQKDLGDLRYIRNYTQNQNFMQYVQYSDSNLLAKCELKFAFMRINFYMNYQTILSELKVYLMNMFTYLQYQYHVQVLEHSEDLNSDMDLEYMMQTSDVQKYVNKHVTALAKSYVPGGVYDCTPSQPIEYVETYRINNNTTTETLSLSSQMSHIENNMVVTNVKFIKINNTIHIQIEETSLSELKNNSYTGTRHWKSLSEHYINTVPFNTDTRPINLDDIFVPAGYVITGIRFDYELKPQDSTPNKLVSYEINVRATPYDFVNNKLITLQDGVPTSIWVTPEMSAKSTSSSYYKRQRTLLHTYTANTVGITRKRPRYIPDSLPNQFVYFRSSGMKSEIVQSAIPHFDARPPYSKYSFPLSGIGISVKGYNGSIGYLTLKTFPYSIPPMY